MGWLTSVPASIGDTVAPAATTIPVIAEIGMPALACIIVVGMASRTAIGIGRERPGNGLAVTGMTAVACQVRTMITRIVARYMTVVGHRSPAVCRMAVVALLGGHEMPIGLARGRAAVMAGVAVPIHTRVIEAYTGPGGG